MFCLSLKRGVTSWTQRKDRLCQINISMNLKAIPRRNKTDATWLRLRHRYFCPYNFVLQKNLWYLTELAASAMFLFCKTPFGHFRQAPTPSVVNLINYDNNMWKPFLPVVSAEFRPKSFIFSIIVKFWWISSIKSNIRHSNDYKTSCLRFLSSVSFPIWTKVWT